MAKKKEEWIDIVRVVPCEMDSDENNLGCKTFCWDHEENKSDWEIYEYTLRVALRQVGHKIKNLHKCYSVHWNNIGNNKILYVEFKTTITNEEWEIARKWNSDIYEEYVGCVTSAVACTCYECVGQGYTNNDELDDDDDDAQPVTEPTNEDPS